MSLNEATVMLSEAKHLKHKNRPFAALRVTTAALRVIGSPQVQRTWGRRIRPEGAADDSRGWSPAQPDGTRGAGGQKPTRPDGAAEAPTRDAADLLRPSGAVPLFDIPYHGLRPARQAAGVAPPVATILGPSGTVRRMGAPPPLEVGDAMIVRMWA